jgi:Zinc finger, ZZ type
MTDMGAPAAESEGVIIHDNIFFCDECEMCPILGARYVASHIYAYDICPLCFQERTPGDRSKFVEFHQPVARELNRSTASLHGAEDTWIVSASIEETAEILEQNTAKEVVAFFTTTKSQ